MTPRGARSRTGDSLRLLAALARVGEQLREGYVRGLKGANLPSADGARSLALCGMGGSGIPADAVEALLADRLGIPIVVSKRYGLPEFVHTDTLVFALSYSGGTEEAVGAYREAVVRGARVIAVTSGGELATAAREDGVGLVEVPGDAPVPRAAFGYLLGALLGALEATGLGPAVGPDVDEAAAVTARAETAAADPQPARDIATAIGRRLPVIWGSEGITEAAALRWKTEFNENAKRPAFAASFPELDHNEIEGWSRGAGREFFLVVLRAAAEHPSVGPRVEATLAAIEDAGLEHREVRAEGHSSLAQLLWLVQTGGLASCLAALDAGVDPGPIDRIQSMKARLRELG